MQYWVYIVLVTMATHIQHNMYISRHQNNKELHFQFFYINVLFRSNLHYKGGMLFKDNQTTASY